jgi:DNA-binding NtrC family response regulator
VNAATKGFTPEAVELLCAYQWPGNIRELRNVIERVIVLHGKKERILPEFLPDEFKSLRPSLKSLTSIGNYVPDTIEDMNLEEAMSKYETKLIRKALEDTKGVQTDAAKMLGTTRRVLKYRMEKLKISLPETEEPAAE